MQKKLLKSFTIDSKCRVVRVDDDICAIAPFPMKNYFSDFMCTTICETDSFHLRYRSCCQNRLVTMYTDKYGNKVVRYYFLEK